MIFDLEIINLNHPFTNMVLFITSWTNIIIYSIIFHLKQIDIFGFNFDPFLRKFPRNFKLLLSILDLGISIK